MTKLVEFLSEDERGVYIHSLEGASQGLVKTAANNYSAEIMQAIADLKRDPMYYYVVINALGSYEIWGANRNGDAFPRAGLSHYSMMTDMATKEDYGYKTFEYYGHLYKHHVNKDPKKGFGKVFFSSWNPRIERVELIVGIDRFKGQDMIDTLESGGLMAVSMGCKLPFDECSICQHKSKEVKDYCIHLRKYMGKIATPEQARQWSLELKKNIMPGASIHAWNWKPRFHDISKVFIGAEVTAYALGKVANHGVISSAALADAEGITDADFDKISEIGKNAIDKVINGEKMNTPDGKSVATGKVQAIRRMLDEKMQHAISEEPEIDNNTLDGLAKTFDLKTLLSTMMGMGIHPHPREFQRIIIIKTGRPDIADYLDEHHLVFDPNADVEPIHIDISSDGFDSSAAKQLLPYMLKRSCFPDYLTPRLEKQAENGIQDYWNNQPQPSILSPATVLAGIAALFAGLKMKAMGMGAQQVIDTFRTQSWIPAMLGSGLSYKILMLDKQKELNKLFVPAEQYENAFTNTYFSGHPLTKTSSVAGSLALGATAGVVALPAGYVLNAYHRKSQYETGQGLFPGSGISPIHFAETVGGGTALAGLMHHNYAKSLLEKAKNLK